MKILPKNAGLERLSQLRSEFAERIREGYENKARSCAVCTTPGACCLDEHFVNVHISRLEAAAIAQRINKLPEAKRDEVYARVEAAISRYGLEDGDTFSRTFACPLYERGTGCLVHDTAKPLPCIAHACYDKKEDLPPGELLAEQEIRIDALNRRVYGKHSKCLPLPVAIRR
ncbi:MAG TPA: hypothetical protein VK612_00680 [Pyrinomonadaceae bacterium]|nr:hypothetical protein [Pyrinomonadaceae bacterium]